MKITVRDELATYIQENYSEECNELLEYLPAHQLNTQSIKAIMLNEIAAPTPEDDFYSDQELSYYMETTVQLFEEAGFPIKRVEELLNAGIYITNVVKTPSVSGKIQPADIDHYLPLLQRELSLFPDAKVWMLMGDVARKAVNRISKQETNKNALPATSTYKLRHQENYFKEIRLLPAYIMTGKNLKIEKSKRVMSAEEISKMLQIIKE
ncbi:hypothetical protein NRIC_04810 [Enterococcus florum]|uniref:Uracil-DNA glycosylase n=1 Tax=Enterococcus florum TaxID=2480627 RepID=A0A4P5P4L9_9ENTE|nr:uracil-DNA glycosylase family protein [Enterococcus florum]GCF92590.1 hypothetical protein NRIC_04810 [Enterococcus florum]